MLFTRFAQLTAALLLLTVGIAAPAHAQQNKPIVSGTWYEDRAGSGGTTGTSNITLTFAQTPPTKYLNVTNVACDVHMGTNQNISLMVLNAGTTSGANDLNRPYSIKANLVSEQWYGGYKSYSIITNQIFYKFGPGRFPSIMINTVQPSGQPGLGAQCVIVGNLSDN